MKRLIFTALLAGSTCAIAAGSHESALRDLAEKEIKGLVSDATIVAAIKAQNEAHASLTESKILELDKQWRAETSESARPLIDSKLGTDASKHLSGVKESKQGLFTEIFVMDNKGLNVALSDVTSDYWQGDEAKWKKTYMAGPNSLHISDVELDESTQTYQAQVSVPIVENGKVIGAATFGVNVDEL